jgi:phosphatidylserine/phosphatidylglycerophosphate/cardiolipin synthase-like enzyme
MNVLEVHYTKSFRRKFISSLSEPIDRVVICSPYFDQLPAPFSTVFDFCISLRRRGVESIQIITRPPGADKTALPVELAQKLAAEDVEIFIRTSPYLHAKLYHFEYSKGYFRSFVGSSNFTKGGFERNTELMTEMEGVGDRSPCHREIARLRDMGALTWAAWIARGRPSGEAESK